MKTLSPALQSHLDEGTTTLAWCWRISRADAVTFGFTDHDRSLAVEGVTCSAESGWTAGAADAVAVAVSGPGVARGPRGSWGAGELLTS